MFKKIMITTDLSVESTAAYPTARAIAETFHASVVLVSVVDTAVQFGYSGVFEMPVVYLPDAVEEIVKRVREELKDHADKHFAGVVVDTRVLEAAGPIYHSLSEIIAHERFDLVIMATHGRSGLRRALMGSVTEQVLRHSTSPVLVVPVNPSRASGA